MGGLPIAWGITGVTDPYSGLREPQWQKSAVVDLRPRIRRAFREEQFRKCRRMMP